MAQAVIEQLRADKLVAVVRARDSSQLVEVARALAAGGIRIIEITFTVPDPPRVLREVHSALGDSILLGAGTILDAETARTAILAGARFIVSPIFDREMIRLARRYNVAVVPGAFTPTEILRAFEAGGDLVKVFPADVGGPAYLKAIAGPLPQIPLMATGGVDLTTISDFLRAGAACLGLGSALVDPRVIAEGRFAELTARAEQFVRKVRGG